VLVPVMVKVGELNAELGSGLVGEPALTVCGTDGSSWVHFTVVPRGTVRGVGEKAKF